MRRRAPVRPRRRPHRLTVLAAVGVAALAVGVGTPPGAATASAAPAERAQPVHAQAPAAAQQQATSLRTLKQRKRALAMLGRVNAVRASGTTCGGKAYPAVPALHYDVRLATAARKHAKDMGRHAYFDHYSRDGRSPGDRARAAGYRHPVGENVAAGYPTVRAVMAGWLASPDHCANLMSAGYRDIGIGYAKVPGSPYGSYWVQDFGMR